MSMQDFYTSLWKIAVANEEDYRIAVGLSRGFQAHYRELAQHFTECIYKKLEAKLTEKMKEHDFWKEWRMDYPSSEYAKDYTLMNGTGIGFRHKVNGVYIGFEYQSNARNLGFGVGMHVANRADWFSTNILSDLNNEFGSGQSYPAYIWWKYFSPEYLHWDDENTMLGIYRELYVKSAGTTVLSDEYVDKIIRCMEIVEHNKGPKWNSDPEIEPDSCKI